MSISAFLGPRIASRVMRGLFVLVVAGLTQLGVAAQDVALPMASHALRVGSSGVGLNVLSNPAEPFYDVIALRVEFQPDTSRFTTGDGTFSDAIYGGLEVTVDPLPHDAGYFEAHLDFLSHYVERVSDGRTVVTTHLVPEVIRVSQPMAAYSPIGENSGSDAEMSKLAALVREAWSLASQQSSFDVAGYDPETTAFVIFHAGAGRDIELTGTSLDRTPQDIPSLYLDNASLQRLSPGPPIMFKTLNVAGNMMLPETESRLGFDFIADEPFVAEFSINGFLAASFFSYLGVPDLFNSETGESAIGSFGLMDPLGIFAHNGLFPPEPSAWTKQFLGWNTPQELTLENEPTIATLNAVSQFGFSDAVRIPVSGSEYFLVENRQRAAETSELVLTVYRNGEFAEQRIGLNEEDFSRFNIDAFEGGVVVAADPYDWALPGVGSDGERYDGGILIWHIDERVIADGLASNSVNTNPLRRGVDVEEADGAQDLGFGSGGVALGTPFDFWYEGNPATAITANGTQIQLYENRFGPDTTPSSAAAEGGPSFVELSEFSASGIAMTFNVGLGNVDIGISPRTALWMQAGVSHPDFGVPSRDHLVHLSDANGGLLAIQGAPTVEADGAFRLFDSRTGDEILVHTGGMGMAVTSDGLIARIRQGDDRARVDLIDRTGIVDSLTYNFSLPPLAPKSPSLIADGMQFLALGVTPNGQRPLRLDRALDAWVEVDLGLTGDVTSIAFLDDVGVVAASNSEVRAENGLAWQIEGAPFGPIVFGQDRGGVIGAIPAHGENAVVWLLPNGETLPIVVDSGTTGGIINDYVSLSDLNGDGYLDIITTSGNKVHAFTQSGAVVAGFPIEIPGASEDDFQAAQPLVAEVGPNGQLAVFVVSRGSIHAFVPELGGNELLGFPLPLGREVFATPLLADGALFGLSRDGLLRAWDLAELGALHWAQRHGNGQSTSSIVLDPDTIGPNATGLLDAVETYNWPNPIRDGRTFIRFRTSEDADVSITIVDLAGALVDELGLEDVRGGIPTEIEWTTEAPSGVYFARVAATTASGREDNALIRMAVIR